MNKSLLLSVVIHILLFAVTFCASPHVKDDQSTYLVLRYAGVQSTGIPAKGRIVMKFPDKQSCSKALIPNVQYLTSEGYTAYGICTDIEPPT